MLRFLTAVEEKESSAVEQAGGSPAFAALYRRHVRSIYRYLYSRVGNQADAEDLTGQVFTEALEGMERYQEQGNFAAWLFTIARRRVIDHYRRRKEPLSLDQAADPLAGDPGPEAQVARQERLDQLAGLVSQLDDEKQELLRLRFAAGLTYSEIGEISGRSEAAAKMAVHRLLRQLEANWEDSHA